MTSAHAAVREVIELHRAFEAWLRDGEAGDDGGPDRFGAALGPRFRMVHPDGRSIEREPLLAGLTAAAGSRPTLELWTTAEVVAHEAGEHCLVLYEEWQREEGRERGRFSSALMDLRGPRPVWLHVQETWMARA